MSFLEWLELPYLTLVIYLIIAAMSGYIHGATGMAGGLILTSILSHQISIKQVVPLVTCALIISHTSRLFMHRAEVEWRHIITVLLLGAPMIIVGAIIFGELSPALIALVFALILSLSFPIKAWAKKKELRTSRPVLLGAGGVWGLLAGCTTGPGFFLAPFLLGTGMNRMTFVGTLAGLTLIMNFIKVGTFGTISLLTPQMGVLGVLLGIATIPGNYAGKFLLNKFSDAQHRLIIDFITVVVICNFLFIAISYL